MFMCKSCFMEKYPGGFFLAQSIGPCECCRNWKSVCADVNIHDEPTLRDALLVIAEGQR